MGNFDKATVLLLVLALAASSLIFMPASATKPSVPDFTVKLVDRSYNVETSYSTNPYTGETITHPGHHVQNLTIEVTIKNQAFTPYTFEGNTTGLFYNVQGKSASEDWTDNPYYDRQGVYAVAASTSQYTVVTFILGSEGWNVPEGSQLDFRVQAVIGYSYYVWSLGGGPLPIGTQFRLVEAGDWSNTQTLTIGNDEVTTQTPPPTTTHPPNTQTPTQNSTVTPLQPVTQTDVLFGLDWKETAIIMLVGIVAVLATALVFSRRKRT
jgi:hypothetical protein